MRKRIRGEAATIVLVVLAAVAGLWFTVPKLFPGSSRRAAQSTEATERVEQATTAQGASAAASVTMIGRANAMAEPSPVKDFISLEVPVALSKLPAPDPKALLEAERRRVAVMEGERDEARRLYEIEAKRASQLQRERDEALAERKRVDLALEQAAAAEHAMKKFMAGVTLIAVLGVALWIYARLNGFSAATLGRIRADMLKGDSLEVAVDRYASPRLQQIIRKYAKLNLEPEDVAPPTTNS